MADKLKYLEISYPNFVLGAIIDPDEANQNNFDIVSSINLIVDSSNTHKVNIADLYNIKADTTYVDGRIAIVDSRITSVKSLLDRDILSNKNSLVTHKSSKDHDARYYTKDELVPYLRNGDTSIKEEVFAITNSNLGDGTFSYTYKGASKVGVLTPEGYQIFKLETGFYEVGKNRLEVTINDTLRRSVASGGVAENSGTSFVLTSPEGAGAEVTVRYYERIGMSSDYTVILSDIKPPANHGQNMWFKVVG